MPIPSHVRLIAGDLVMVPAVVRYDNADTNKVGLSVGEFEHSAYVFRDEITLVSTKIEVGDEVGREVPHSVPTGIVKAIIGDKAWVEKRNGADIVDALSTFCRLRTRQQILDDAEPAETDAPSLMAAE